MTGEVIQWPNRAAGYNPGIKTRLEGLRAIFHAIDAGELLAALPDCQAERLHHTAAVTLLAVAEREIMRLLEEIDQ